MTADHEIFELGTITLQSGEVLPDAKLAYRTWGRLNANRDNVVVLPTFFTGTHIRNQAYFGPGRAIDPARHFIVVPNTFGNGVSSSPSNTPPPFDGPRFPTVTHYDNVECQYRLLRERFGVERVALVAGWSMGGSQSYHWAARYPDQVGAIVPFCASARISVHNRVFLAGVRAALEADADFRGGDYDRPPERGLRAFGRVYCGWAYSQTWFREGLYRELGFADAEALLVDWERDHLAWDANDLLCKLRTWELCDIGAHPRYGGSFEGALGAIGARAILIPCTTDLYFTPQDNAIEAQHMPNAEFRPFDSCWGHVVASGDRIPEFHRFLDTALADALRG